VRLVARSGWALAAALALVTSLVPGSAAEASTGGQQVGAEAVTPAVTAADTVGTFVPMTPARMLDTRPGGHTVDGQLAGIGAVQGGARIINIVGRAGVPAAATAVVVNVTVTGATASTYVSVYPGPYIPPTSTINATRGATIAVASTVELTVGDATGDRPGTLWVYNRVGAIQVILDVTGYYLGTALAPGSVFHPQSPVRVLDTRASGHAPIASQHFDSIALSNLGTTSVAVNVTVTGARAAGYVTVWPGKSSAAPLATSSTLNFRAGQTVANMAVVGTPLSGGKPTFSVGNGGAGPVQVIVDVVGWYSSSSALAVGGLRFHPISPVRLVDTRVPTGARPLGAGTVVTLATAGKVGDALTQAVVANLTGLGDPVPTYLAAYPGPSWPGTSSLNLGARQTTSNMIMTGLALPARTFDLKNSAGVVQALVDVTGYFEGAPPVTVSLVSDHATAAADQAVTMTVTVTPVGTGSVPPGRVVLVDSTSGSTLASRAFAGPPVVIVTAALSPGTHPLVAEFLSSSAGSAPVSSAPTSVSVTALAVGPDATFQMDADHTGEAAGSSFTSSIHQAWTVDLGGDLTYPLIAGGRVFAVATDTSDTADLYALDQVSGAIDWGPLVVGPGGAADGVAQIAYDGGTVFAVTTSGYVAAFSAADGASLWSAQLALPNGAGAWPPVAVDGVLYVSVAGEVYALTEDSGFQTWSAPTLPSSSGASPDVDSSGVYVGSPCAQTNGFTMSGAARWPTSSCVDEGATASVRMGEAWVPSSPINGIVDLSTGALAGIPYSFDRIPEIDAQGIFLLMSGGAITSYAGPFWTFTGDGALDSTPVIAGGLVFVRSWKGTLFAVDLSTGHVVWSGPAGVALTASTWQTGGYLGLTDGVAASGGIVVVPVPISTGSHWALEAFTSS
jgi:outer membrane protein assembly factor BamB